MLHMFLFWYALALHIGSPIYITQWVSLEGIEEEVEPEAEIVSLIERGTNQSRIQIVDDYCWFCPDCWEILRGAQNVQKQIAGDEL